MTRLPRALALVPYGASSVCAFLALILLVPSQPVRADNYLSAIEAEAGGLEVLGKARREQQQLREKIAAEKKQVPAPSTARKPGAKEPPTATDRAAFERELRKEFPSSYGLYSLLTPSQREAVVQEYRQSPGGGYGRFLPALSKIVDYSIGR